MGLEAKNPYENDNFKSDESGELGDLITGIDHVAYAVTNLDDALEEYRETFGILVDHREIIEAEGIEIAVLRVGDSTIQLLTPTRDDADLVEFLQEWGPGVHHVGYRVADCAQALAVAVSRGLEVLDDEPRPGLLGATVADLHPDALHGTLIQLVEI